MTEAGILVPVMEAGTPVPAFFNVTEQKFRYPVCAKPKQAW